MYGLLGIGSGYYLWRNRAWFQGSGERIFVNRHQQHGGNVLGTSTANSNVVASNNDNFGSSDVRASIPENRPVNNVDSNVHVESPSRIAEARAARLKRFAEMNAPSNVATYQQLLEPLRCNDMNSEKYFDVNHV